jgi:tRNA G18 (ribose-2'-O)-methylase SpoU
MFHVHHIASLDLPELAPYRTMKRPVSHVAQGIFVAEGDKVVHRLLQSNFHVISVLLPEKRVAEFEPALRARPEDIAVYLVSNKGVLESLVGFEMFQGVMAIGKIPAHLKLDDVLSNSPPPRLFVAVDALTNSENLGVLVRNCAAFGAHALIVGETCASPFLRRAVRNSMGAIFRLPIIESSHLAQTLRDLSERNMRCIAAHPPANEKNIFETNFSTDCCVVLGSEGHGISKNVLEACHESVAIPISAEVDSLNVSNAAAVFLYEVRRQRGSSR